MTAKNVHQLKITSCRLYQDARCIMHADDLTVVPLQTIYDLQYALFALLTILE